MTKFTKSGSLVHNPMRRHINLFESDLGPPIETQCLTLVVSNLSVIRDIHFYTSALLYSCRDLENLVINGPTKVFAKDCN